MSRGAGTGEREMPAGRARKVRLVILDVDGVLTDGGVYIGGTEGGEPVEMKRFHIQDGLGVKMLEWAGIRVAIVSGRMSVATRIRALELGVDECHEDPDAAKLPVVREILRRYEVEWDEVAYVADDLADLPVFRRVGLPVAVVNAVDEIREHAAWVTGRRGGHGAVREFSEALLRAQGKWGDLVRDYCEARDED